MTFTIVARCRRTGQVGAAVSSSSPAVAARCIRVRAGVGAVASQNVTDPALGPQLLDLLASGHSATQAVAALSARMPHPQYRQLLAVDSSGQAAIYSGSLALGTVGECHDADVACAGNLLAHTTVPARMLEAFGLAEGALADRLIAAMQAGKAAGGEAGPVHSAGLLIADRYAWPVVDLRIDWTDDDPIEGLAQLWARYKPQLDGYVQRAIDPAQAPAYGVPGENR
jgi:uncharacterized Ntn-hydrolase superfamily protein